MPADFYFDVGKETCPRQTYLSTADVGNSLPAEIRLWKKCCLDSYYTWCRDGEKRDPCKQTLYPTAMLGDTVSMGVEPCANSQLRAGGLVYSQFYGSVKGSMQKSFGVREEHRVSVDLFHAINRRFGILNLRQQKFASAVDEVSYFTHPTTTALSSYRWNINKFCVGFEMVYSLSGRQWVTWQHTRIMPMFLRCLRFCYGHGQLQESAGCWREVRYTTSSDAPDGLRRTEGIGFEVTMSQQYMLFNNPSIQQAYHARYGQIRESGDVRDDFIQVNRIQQLIQQFDEIPACLGYLEVVLLQICSKNLKDPCDRAYCHTASAGAGEDGKLDDDDFKVAASLNASTCVSIDLVARSN
ncbi:hypothetical protein BKA64DRAFT_728089 [Cadophora sp. MPI-SDFR-AT-0126]|nr:hypothetical protein BKA64DRAFT_728089 [Leotiomycetes sp. MPI-SDFR-AT-0126]